MTIAQIYSRYRIMPQLQLHMYRVAAVGNVILDNWRGPQVNRDLITQVLLLHDMANIVKFDLSGKPAWQKIQQDFISRYGSDEFQATVAIAQELKLTERMIYLIGHRSSPDLGQVVKSSDWELKLASYPDFRVAPGGVVSVKKRWDDISRRYRRKTHPLAQADFIATAYRYCLELESQLQPFISLPLNQITDSIISPYLKSLPNYELIPPL